MKKRLPKLLMLGVSLAIVGILVWQVRNDAAFENFRDQPKHWGLFLLGGVFGLFALLISLVRWYLLVRALNLPFRLRDAFRLGFLGYLFNFVSPGNVGGDLFKAFFIAKEQHGRRAEAVATVVVDRIIGLYGLLLVASAVICCSRVWDIETPEIYTITRGTLILTILGGIGLLMMLIPGFTQGALSEMLTSLPKVGPTIGKLIGAVRMYRSRAGVLVIALLMSLVVHCCVVVNAYLIARALPGTAPSLTDHFVIIPLAMVVGAIPIFPMGLGAFEGAVEFLYAKLPAHPPAEGQGLLLAFGYRLITIGLAMIGAVYYFTSRSEVKEVMHEVEEVEEDPDSSALSSV